MKKSTIIILSLLSLSSFAQSDHSGTNPKMGSGKTGWDSVAMNIKADIKARWIAIGPFEKNNPVNATYVFNDPGTDEFKIMLPIEGKAEICLYDVSGNCIYSLTSNENSEEIIDLSGRRKGIYFAQMTSEKERQTVKIVLE